MKQGWEYKKLGEVCEVVSGSTPKTNVPEYWGEGHYWVTPAELNDTIVYIDKTERQITDEALTKTKLRLLPVGTVLLSSRAPIGKVAITKTEMYCNQGFKNCICSDSIYNKYLFYFLRLKKEYLNSLGRGATFKEISKSIVESITIPLPPKSTQLTIVSELDKINELIRLKKGQLKDYDNLAQSIFYEMFGDPVENDKGWEVKELGQLCEVTSSKRVFINEVVDAGVPFIRGTELTALNKLVPGEKMHYTLFITQEHYERLKAITGVPKVGDLLIPSINADGIVWMVDTEKPLYFKDGRVLWIHVNHNHFNSIAIQKLMNILIKNIYASMGGATFAELKLFVLRNMKVPIPPLSVQDAFAEKIKRIDIQKLQVKKSITDLETLLASRMQYWFE